MRLLSLALLIAGCAAPADVPPVSADDDDAAIGDDDTDADDDSGDDDSEKTDDDDDDDTTGDDDTEPTPTPKPPTPFWFDVCNASAGQVNLTQIYSMRPGSSSWTLEWAPSGGGMAWGLCQSIGPYLPGEWSFLAVDGNGGLYCTGPAYIDSPGSWAATYPSSACQL